MGAFWEQERHVPRTLTRPCSSMDKSPALKSALSSLVNRVSRDSADRSCVKFRVPFPRCFRLSSVSISKSSSIPVSISKFSSSSGNTNESSSSFSQDRQAIASSASITKSSSSFSQDRQAIASSASITKSSSSSLNFS
ncbi:hypothetical protein QAD02_013258 [Eretmocerus hayati]|uniref:Uncharacterized protein n=1 Tax=Eretmocerus hayati TaxID=131215 RepID=A0ACC2P3S2_9HYME|nr:hypothetical protein QAD02_013258 [Eretmocerus hayati]